MSISLPTAPSSFCTHCRSHESQPRFNFHLFLQAFFSFYGLRLPTSSNSCVRAYFSSMMSSSCHISEQNLEQLEGLQLQDDDEECRTPTSRNHQIPTIQSCPPTPRKRPRSVLAQKRKWTDQSRFFETTRREELESFFRSIPELPRVSSRVVKRRCTSV